MNYPADDPQNSGPDESYVLIISKNIKVLSLTVKTDLYDLSMIMDDADILTDTIAIQLDIDVEQEAENPRICRRQGENDYIERLSF